MIIFSRKISESGIFLTKGEVGKKGEAGEIGKMGERRSQSKIKNQKSSMILMFRFFLKEGIW